MKYHKDRPNGDPVIRTQTPEYGLTQNRRDDLEENNEARVNLLVKEQENVKSGTLYAILTKLAGMKEHTEATNN